MKLFQLIDNHKQQYRPIPFWSFNGKLEKAELEYQISEMHHKGIGGYFMHARSGCLTEYFSEEWFNRISDCLALGERLGMDSYAYDENGWPSGFADGQVTKNNPEYALKWLEIVKTDSPYLLGDVLALFEAREGVFVRVERYTGGEVFAVVMKTSLEYIDTLDADAVGRFISVVYEEYRRRFGSKLKGFFTDEPQYGARSCPWSNNLPQEFYQKHGYDIVENLISLFFDTEKSAKVRYDFYSFVSNKLKNSYYKQLYDWCDRYGYILTGHGYDENTLSGQVLNCGDIMSMYEYMHMPGIDWLGRGNCGMNVPKQVYSVARQLGKARVLTESFALTGWGVTPRRLKSILERQYAGGVSVVCQHLFSYTLRGQRKRDCPPSLFVNQSWWDKVRDFNDYFTALGALLANAENHAELLVLSPLTSMYLIYSGKDTQKSIEYDMRFKASIAALEESHINYDLGSEVVLSRHGKVNGARLRVGQAEYKRVLLPHCISLDLSTVSLLSRFVEEGGELYYTGNFPAYIEGEPSDKLADLATRCKQIDSMGCLRGSELVVETKGEVVSCQRVCGEERIVFLVNNQDTAVQAKIKIPHGLNAGVLDLLEKRVTPIDSKGCVVVKIEAFESCLLVVGKFAPLECESHKKQYISVGNSWDMKLLTPNCMVLDSGYCSVDGGEFVKMRDVRLLFEELMKRRKNCEVVIKHSFNVAKLPSELFFATEMPEEKSILVNGKRIDKTVHGSFVDKSIQKMDILPHVVVGRNEIEIRTFFYQTELTYFRHNDALLEAEKNRIVFNTELENSYLVGNFGVFSSSAQHKRAKKVTDSHNLYAEENNVIMCDGNFVIDGLPTRLDTADLITQGLIFFANAVRFDKTVSLDINSIKGRAFAISGDFDYAEVFINDKLAAHGFSSCIECGDEFFKDGENRLSVVLYNNLRNLFGPFHNALCDPVFVGSSTFTDTQGWCDPNIQLWQSQYYFVPFGFSVIK